MTPNHLALSLLRQLETEHREITERIIEFKRLFKLEDWDTGFVDKKDLSQALHNSRKIVASYMGEGESLVDELIEERREEARKEDEGIQLYNKWQQVTNEEPKREETPSADVRKKILELLQHGICLSTYELAQKLKLFGVHRRDSNFNRSIGSICHALKKKGFLVGFGDVGWRINK